LGLGGFESQNITKNFLDLRDPPSRGPFLEKGFQLCPSFLLLLQIAASSPFSIDEEVAEIVFSPVAHPFGGGLPALILGVFIMKEAVEATVKIPPTVRAYLLSPHLPLNLHSLSAGGTTLHVTIIHRKGEKLKTENEFSRHHLGFSPISLASLAHFAIPSLIMAAICSGVFSTGSAPKVLWSRSKTSGIF